MTTANLSHTVQQLPNPLPNLAPTQARQTTTPPTHALSSSDTPDSQLAAAYRTTLLKTTGNTVHDAQVDVVGLPPSALFSQCWSLLGRAIQGSKFSQWMTRAGVEPDSMVITPGKGRVSFRLKGDPKQVVHTLGRHNPEFAAASSEVMAIAKIITAGNPDASLKPPLSPRSNRAPLEVVRHFQREPQTATRAAIAARAAELSRNNAFIELPMQRHEALHRSRSETVLEQHQAALADIDGRYRVAGKLRELSEHVEATGASVDIASELTKRKVKIPFDSSYQPDNADTTNRVSLKQYLDDHQLDIPTHQEQLNNLATALMTATPHAPANGSYSGALGWPAPIDSSVFQALQAAINQGNVGDSNFGAFKNVLEYLLDKRPVSASEARDPRHLIDNLLKSPKGKALGAALQAHFQAQSIKGSANDWLLASMSLTKDEAIPAAS